jgi:superfamily I DNA/RNA helicase
MNRNLRAVTDEDEAIGDLQIAEYVVFLLALDTYMRYVEEATNEEPADEVTASGVRLLRISDAMIAEGLSKALNETLPTEAHKKLLARAMAVRAINPINAGRRALLLRTVLSRGGPATQRVVFQTNRALKEIREAISASMIDDADSALDRFAAISMRNTRLKNWIALAAKTAVQREIPKNAVESASNEATDQASVLLNQQVQSAGSQGAEDIEIAKTTHSEVLHQVQQEATSAAKKALDTSGEADTPPTRSETVGIAVAAATAALGDPSKPQNIPDPLRKLDDEQRAAALTDGRVLVAAGAGSGKSTTLVARVEYLVKERRVFPSRVLVTSFNTKAANELKQKIGSATSGETLQQMSVGTMHSLFRKFIGEYGTPQERSAMGLGKDPGGFVQGGGAVARAVQRIWSECYPADTPQERKVPKLKTVLMAKSKWSGNNITPVEAKALARTQEELDSADWYEMYEGMKGSLPGWEPPCGSSKGYESFMGKWRPNDQRLADFDDMLIIFRSILKREPMVRKTLQGMFDHILVDECVHEDTEVLLETGESKKVSELETGDKILSYQNGSAVFKSVLAKKLSGKTSGVTIHTKSGHSLTMTLDHRLYATQFDPEIPEGELALYLMYRHDMGFRIGVSSIPYLIQRSTHDVKYRSHRAGAEKADCMWVLETGEASEILFRELDYSLDYQIPARLFEAEVRLCDQNRSDRIFAKYGQNGAKLLELYGLSKEYPHWVSTSSPDRKVVSISAHRSGGMSGHRSNGRRTTAGMSWSPGDNEPMIPANYKVYDTQGGLRKTVHISDTTYVGVRKAALALAKSIEAYVVEDILVQDQSCLLTNAGSLRVGMSVPIWVSGQDNTESVIAFMRGREIRELADKYRIPVPAKGCVHGSVYEAIRQAHLQATHIDLKPLDDSKIVLGEIVAIVPEAGGVFYDITVEDSGNFFGNGVLSHNCQDLNQCQNDIVEMMSEHIKDGSDGKSVWMVGDPNQSIYTFRGARPDIFLGRAQKEDWKVRTIRTNYRCQPEIVDAANKLISHNEGRLPMEAVPSPAKVRGVGSVRVRSPGDEAEAALSVVEEIKSNIEAGGDVADNAILTRTNKEQHAFETACIIRGVPYARKGASSFLGSPETKAFLSYVQLATGDDFAKMQAALGEVINKPNRFFVAPEAGATAVSDALSAYAKRNGQDIKTVNPLVALGDPFFQSVLAEKLTRVRAGFKFQKAIEKLEDIQHGLGTMQANSENPEYTTKDLFDEILGMTGTVAVMDPRTGRAQFVEQTFRDSLKADLRDSVSEDDDTEDEDDTEGLGNISFLYELVKKDPTDPGDLLTDPNTPTGFKAKMERYGQRARELRIDITKWDKEQATLPPEQRKPPPGTYLGTVHSVKGAQWKNCYVSMPRGKFPFTPPVKPGQPPPDPEVAAEEMESERRLGYVALTRAAMNLTVICPKQVGGKAAGISPFVDEAGLKLGENVPKPGATPAIEESPEVQGDLAKLAGYEGIIPDEWEH